MEMNEKCIKIMNYLVQQKNFTSYTKLAEIFQMSDRMVRKYVDTIEEFLSTKGLNCFERKYGSGIKIHITDKLLDSVLLWQNRRTSYQYTYSKEERNDIVLATLLLENKPMSQRYFAQMLNVSDATIVRQMDQVQEVVNTCGMTLVRKNNMGLYVQGNEFDRQVFLVQCYHRYVNFGNLKAYMHGDIAHIDGSKLTDILFDRLNDRGELIYSSIELFESEHKIQFDDASFVRIFLQIFILVVRIQAGIKESVYHPPAFAELFDDWQDELQFIEKIEQQYQIQIGMDDRIYIIAGLYSGSQALGMLCITEHYKIMESTVEQMISVYEEVSGIQFGIFRKKLMKNLIRHIQPVMALEFFKLPANKSSCDHKVLVERECLNYTKMAIGDFENCIGRRLEEDEISTIAVYFRAIEIKIHKSREDSNKVLLVCGAGIGISNLIAIQLRRQFQVDTIITTSSRQFDMIPRESYQHIISTIEIAGLPPQDYVLISPCYTLEDQKKVAAVLRRSMYEPARYDQLVATSSRLLKRMEKYSDIADKQYLQMEIIDELLSREDVRAERRDNSLRGQLNIWDMINEGVVRVKFQAESWQEAVEEGVSLLEKTGAVEAGYADDIVSKILLLGPYMAIMPQVFFSHAENNGNVYSAAISILTLKKGITVGRDDCDPIRLVITLAAPDSTAHLRAVAQLFGILRKRDNVDKIINSKNSTSILKMIMQQKWREPYEG